jgi:hypothetical protein
MELADCVIGLDPGTSGGIAWSAKGSMSAKKLDGLTEYDVRGLLIGLVEEYDSVHAYLEVVGPNRIAKEGERRQGASGMFTFGRSYGFLRGVLVGLAISFEDVRPVVWQRTVGIGSVAEETTAEKKRRHRAKAQQYWPKLKVTLNTCDALLIAEYGLRQHLIPQSFNQSAVEQLEGA